VNLSRPFPKQWTQDFKNLFSSLLPLFPLAALASAFSDLRFSALIIGGLLLSAATLWKNQNALSVQLMPVIALSAIIYGVEARSAILTGAVVGFSLLLLSFTPWLVPLLKVAPANVLAAINAAIAALILQRGLAAFRGLAPLHHLSVPNILPLILAVAVLAVILALLLRGKTATALAAIFVLTAISSPDIFLQIRPHLPLHLSFPPLHSLKTTAFPFLLPEFFYTGIAVLVAAARFTPDSPPSSLPDEVTAVRIAGSLATLAAYPLGFIPAIPTTTPPTASALTAPNAPPILPALIAIASVITLSGPINALPNHLPIFVIPGLCLLAAWPLLHSLRPVTHFNDQMVVLSTTIFIFATRSFGWAFLAALFASALIRMLRGESPLSFPPQELRNL
jgi:hypothetical protein